MCDPVSITLGVSALAGAYTMNQQAKAAKNAAKANNAAQAELAKPLEAPKNPLQTGTSRFDNDSKTRKLPFGSQSEMGMLTGNSLTGPSINEKKLIGG